MKLINFQAINLIHLLKQHHWGTPTRGGGSRACDYVSDEQSARLATTQGGGGLMAPSSPLTGYLDFRIVSFVQYKSTFYQVNRYIGKNVCLKGAHRQRRLLLLGFILRRAVSLANGFWKRGTGPPEPWISDILTVSDRLPTLTTSCAAFLLFFLGTLTSPLTPPIFDTCQYHTTRDSQWFRFSQNIG